MRVLVVDGQGGKIGSALVAGLLAGGLDGDLVAVGTNSAATAAMIRAGAEQAATGENPVVVGAGSADIIAGPIGIVAANSLLGEITPKMSQAISTSTAQKILIPINKCNITVVGVQESPLGELIERAVELILSL